MVTQSVPIFLFAAASIGLAVTMVLVGTILGPKRTSAVKRMPYESGMDPIHDTQVGGLTSASTWWRSPFWCSTWNCCSSIPWAVASRAPDAPIPGVATANQTLDT